MVACLVRCCMSWPIRRECVVAVTSDPPPLLYDSPEEPKKIYDPPVSSDKGDVGDYWLPWHIDSNFVTIIHKEMYAYESDGSFAPEPEGYVSVWVPNPPTHYIELAL